ncbi:sigma-70 family RNA polymerase sigma factor [Catenulispora sp. NL8]|uniref:Sigma-70 family RNA polymerase sigma factor n=1 Tax=Catenulispora pinistramenti TaxID=2705254 RepID=A0ABS5L4J5_9ACTN|nr:sigma-70 family RNA polymerase sigma factor [Catenulispora pinistramenti]MBS2553283.1 sigma-70 family RNA polymerase sigma factor [Catenulispora pinistramenti]
MTGSENPTAHGGADADTSDVGAAVAAAHRAHWAPVLAATVRVTRDLDIAEECVQDAYTQALRTWPSAGIPEHPGAWLRTVAGNRARDLLRRESVWRRAMPLLVEDDTVPGPQDAAEPPAVADDTLRLIFTCCHPALSREARVALTLRLVCGLSTAEVARAFLVQESTMAARITRAKKKIATARIPYRVPTAADLPERVSTVCDVVHLVFTTGSNAPVGAALIREDLVASAVGLARTLHRLLPVAEPAGLLALLLLIDARRATRTADDGQPILLADQDRSRWDRRLIAEGTDLLTEALRGGPPTRYAVQAAIAAVHAEAPDFEATDWSEIVALYDVLLRLWPSPVVELNRAVAVGMRDGPRAGLIALDDLAAEPALATYRYLSAARADFLRKLKQWPEAITAYEEALVLTDNEPERAFLAARLAEVRRAARS